MEEELPIDPVNKGGQVTNVHNVGVLLGALLWRV
jgi:hypothetical protein